MTKDNQGRYFIFVQPTIRNFLIVYLASLWQPLQLLILGSCLLLAVAIPGLTLIIIPLGLSTVAIRSLLISFDPTFINRTLTHNLKLDFKQLIALVNSTINKSRHHESRDDLIKTRQILFRAQSSWQNLEPEKQKRLDFLIYQLPQLVTKLNQLAGQEDLTRTFLKQQDPSIIQQEILSLRNLYASSGDKVVAQEYAKSIALKQYQLQESARISNKLQRLDSYVVRIQSEIENINTQITKLALQELGTDDYQSQQLNQNLSNLGQEIDIFEEEMDKLQTDQTK